VEALRFPRARVDRRNFVMRVGLVGCVKTKRATASPAGNLYVSPLFEGRRRAVEESCDRWYVLSAEHRLVDPHRVLDPYDVTLVGAATAFKRRWARDVLAQLEDEVGPLDGHTFEIHAGANYCDFGLVQGIVEAGGRVERPAQGLALGQQLAFYESQRPPTRSPVRRNPPPRTSTDDTPRRTHPQGRNYERLSEWLEGSSRNRVEVTFSELEGLLGLELPVSARRHRAWWANDLSHTQARAWLHAGYRSSDVDLSAEIVTFDRG
jgi:hypothetical protein